MNLGARFLENVADVNTWSYLDNVELTEGDAGTVYIQLVDIRSPDRRRYMPAAGAVLTCTVDSINDAKKVTRVATQPFAQDPSIWALSLLATDALRGTLNLKLHLAEGATVRTSLVRWALRFIPNDTL